MIIKLFTIYIHITSQTPNNTIIEYPIIHVLKTFNMDAPIVPVRDTKCNNFVRIRAEFIPLYSNSHKIWILIDSNETRTIEQLLTKFAQQQNIRNDTKLKISLEKYYIPKYESVNVFKDNDKVKIR